MDATQLVNLGPLLQYGFAGFALIQFGCFVWIGLKVIDALRGIRDAMAANAAKIEAMETALGGQPCQMTLDNLRALVRRLSPAEG